MVTESGPINIPIQPLLEGLEFSFRPEFRAVFVFNQTIVYDYV